jgi:hypothetical protein
MILALTERNKLNFADGSIDELSEGDPQHLAWGRNDSIIHSWIINSVSREIQASFVYFNCAFEISNNLQFYTRVSNFHHPNLLETYHPNLGRDRVFQFSFSSTLAR